MKITRYYKFFIKIKFYLQNLQYRRTFVVDLKFKTMKKLLLAVTLAATFSLSATAADGKKVNDDVKGISYFVLNKFNADFLDAQNVVWTITPTSLKADFTIDDVKKTAFYSLEGNFLGVTQEINYKLLPEAAKKEIASNYKDYTVGQVIKFEANNPQPAFFVNLAITEPQSVDYFVDLKKADAEVLVRVTEQGAVSFFKQVK